ncbi:RipA family octameric membrane protein [Nostoc sp.]
MSEQLPNRNDDLDSIWKIARDLIEHEDNLINHRMTWLITSNFFLFSAFFVIFNPQFGSQPVAKIFSLLIPLIGIVICWIVWQLVRSAAGQVNEVNNWWREQLNNYPENKQNYPFLIGQSKYSFKDWKNIYSIIPFVMMLAWVMLLCVSLIYGFQLEIFSYRLIPLVAIALLFYIGFFIKGNR